VGERSASRSDRFTVGEVFPRTYWIVGSMGGRVGLDKLEKNLCAPDGSFKQIFSLL